MAERRPRRSPLKVLGPGLITGAADDDPSGIGTYSQVGAQFGYGLAWTMFFGFPLLAAIQAICARIGATTGKGIARNLRQHYPPWLLRSVVVLLLIANVINIGADLGAMGAVLALVVPGPALLFTVLFGAISVLLEVVMSYDRYARVLKWTTLSLFAYAGVVLVAHVPLGEALRGTLIPHFSFGKEQAMALVAIFGTTISPYLFFWQAGQEVEEQRRRHVKPLHVSPRRVGPELARIRTDTLVGMGFSHLTALFIVIATAATLHANGITTIESADQAAQALRPVAGDFAFALFALGIIGTGLLAVPILAGSAAYAVCESFDWVEGLNHKPREAKAFYGVIALATLGGIALNTVAIDPMKALYWAAVVNGLLAPPLMVVTMLIARNRRIMGDLAIKGWLEFGGWLSTAVMWVVAGVFLLS
ncbi:MAG: divalent metal cation transporter [Proteobacteria bacterium]|nr:divalent metal cation transporter [Pseudomonadota bacterium]